MLVDTTFDFNNVLVSVKIKINKVFKEIFFCWFN